MLLSILIPAFGEEKTIAEVLQRVAAIDIASLGFQKQIIVCDDGSHDNTVACVQEVMQEQSCITLVQHEQNRGKGAAIRTALELAEGDYCLVQDADLEYDIDDYPALLHAINNGARVVYGSRFLEKKWPQGMKFPNFMANRLLAMAANLLYGLSITDEATCFKVIETKLLRSLHLECEGFEFCPEVTAKIAKQKVPIHEVPISYLARNVEEGKKVRWTDGFEALWVLLRHRRP